MAKRPFEVPSEQLPLFGGTTRTKEEAWGLLEQTRGEQLAAARACARVLIQQHGKAVISAAEGFPDDQSVHAMLWRDHTELMERSRDLGLDNRWRGPVFKTKEFRTIGRARKKKGGPGESHGGGYLEVWTFADGHN